MNEYDVFMELYWNGETKIFRGHRALVSIFLLLEKVVAWNRTWAPKVRGWRQTARVLRKILTRNSKFSCFLT